MYIPKYIKAGALTCKHLRLCEQLQDTSAADVSVVEISLDIEVFLKGAIAVLGSRSQSWRNSVLLVVPYVCMYACMYVYFNE